MRGLPLLGTNVALLRNPEGFLIDAHREYGPVFRIQIAFEQYTVITGEQGCAYFREFREKGLTREPFYGSFARELGTDYFILSEPQGSGRHGRLRRMMKLGFSREAAAAYVPDMIAAVRSTALSWQPGRCLPVMDAMARLTFQLYGFVMADCDLLPMYTDAKLYAQTIMMLGAKLIPPALLGLPAYRRSKQAVFELMEQLFAASRARDLGSRTRLTILDALLQALDTPDASHTEAEIVSSALYGFVGTMVYMNRAVSFLLYELARNPATMERATREADAAFADGMPTADTLRRMVYLRAALNESLRRHPIAIGLPFVVEEAFDFEGYRIEKGETILISHITGHLSQHHFRDPWKFEPERFLDPRSEHRSRGVTYAPFGFGGRACTAVGLVETMVLATVATLLHTLRFELERPSYDLRVHINPLPGPEESFRLRVMEHRTPPPAIEALPPIEEAVGGVLAAANTDLVEDVLSRLEVRGYSAHATIIRQGAEAEEFYVLAEGEVAVLQAEDEQPAVEVARLVPGQYFGEIGLLTNCRRNATVAALDQPVTVLVIPREAFLSIVTEADLISSDIALLARRRFLSQRLTEALPQLSEQEADDLTSDFRVDQVPGGQVIIWQGEPAETFHIVASGVVEVLRDGPEGEQLVARLGAGEYFGEMGLLMRRPRTATVRAAAEGAEVMTISREAFQRLMTGSGATKDEVMLRLLSRIGDLLDAAGRREKVNA